MYNTLLEAIRDLQAQGYTEDFNLRQNCLECRNQEFNIFHDEFHIDNAFRFDVDSDPADQSILYAISSDKYNLKGLLVNSYGIYTDDISDEMMAKLNY